MSTFPKPYTQFNGGIADFSNEGPDNSYAFGRSIDVRSDPHAISILPRTVKESGSTVTDLIKWAETYVGTLTTYMYGNAGNIYSRDTSGNYTFLRTVANSHGNGLLYSPEDNYLYYALDKVIGRYGPLNASSPSFNDDFLASFGGVPLNTNALDLEAGSSQYASRADTASLSITGDLAIDMQIKPETLPAAAEQMVLVSKWNESGTTRSYKFDLNTASGYFGDGSEGNHTVSADMTDNPIDSACLGNISTTSLTATNASFTAGQQILIHQSQGTGAGNYMRNTIISYVPGTITLETPLNATYSTGAQVLVLRQYVDVTVDAGVTWTAKAWNGTTGGILAFLSSGTTTINGTISATGKGFRGGAAVNTRPTTGLQGEGTAGAGTNSTSANGNGGGGGASNSGAGTAGGGAGGGHAAGGSNGQSGDASSGAGGTGGNSAGSADLTTLVFGGGGGSGGTDNDFPTTPSGAGGNGGGIIFLTGATITNTGSITSAGNDGGPTNDTPHGGGGGGAGGSILMKSQTATLGAGLITAAAGTGNTARLYGNGGSGSVGRIHLDYYTSYTGTTSPTLDATQDNDLVTNTTTQLRLSVSSSGLDSEVLAYEVPIALNTWQQVGVSWESSTATATFFLNAVAIGTRTGSFTVIHDNAATFQIGMSQSGAGAAEKFYDGLVDEVRIFNTTRTALDFLYGASSHIAVNTPGLQAYYKLNSDYVDATANANNLTATNAPVFVTDVPFSSPTTRYDIDQSAVTAGNTYAVPTAISEAAVDRKTFTPARDPQKSLQLDVSNIGTGDWTVTIHDSSNNTVATATAAAADMHTGNYEFTYASVWSPLTNFTNEYHIHVTCASGSPTIVSGTANDLETVDYVTYYQFLVEDQKWHPMAQFLNYWVIGNGRYIGKYEAPLYEPNKITLEAGWKIRCFAKWDDYLAIGVTRSDVIDDTDQGRIYFWDGIASTFNYPVDVPEGGINAMLGSGGRLYVWAGYKNQLLVYEGGRVVRKMRDMPNIEAGSYSEIYPQGVCMWRSLLRYGAAGDGNSTNLQKGVYTYGSTNSKFPEALTYDYPISTGNYTGTTVQIGMTTVVKKKLLISWRDNMGYGVDYVDETNSPYPTALVQFLMSDLGAAWKQKQALQLAANFDPLVSGQSVSIGYALQGTANFVTNMDATAVGDTISRMAVSNGQYNEIQAQATLTTSSTSPSLKSVVVVSELNESEEVYG